MTAVPQGKESLLEAYRAFCAPGAVEELERLATSLAGRSVLHLYSHGFGDDRTRMVHRLGSIMASLGIYPRWDVLVGTEEFFEAVRTLREGLLGRVGVVSPRIMQAYQDCLRGNAGRIYLEADYVLVHDFQPFGLVEWRGKDSKWIWRCHHDLSHAAPALRRFCLNYIRRYDAAVFSHPKFTHKVPVPLSVIAPSIDPLHERNHQLSPVQIERILTRLGIPQDRPIVLVVLRESAARQSASLLDALQALGKRLPLRLVVARAGISEIEGGLPLEEIRRRVGDRAGVHLLNLSSESHRELNALGRAAHVCVHTLHEGGLEVSVLEDLWRGKPVIAGPRIGRVIPVVHGKTGFVARSVTESVLCTERVLKDSELARRVGEGAHELIRERYLITRHVRDYLMLFRRLTETGR